MKPKLKPDVYWVPQDDTLAFIHSGDPLTVRGRSALPLMDRLAPYLDGTVDLDDLVGGLPEPKREMVITLVNALAGAGLVKDAQHDDPHPLSAAELERYAAEIEYIDHHVSSAGRRFHDFRTTRVTCLGAGISLTALVHACLRAGIAHLTVLVGDECPTDLGQLDRHAAESRETDPEQRMDRRPLDGLSDAVRAADVVLHVSDRPVLARARELDRLCREHGRPLIQGIVVEDEAWTGPTGGSVGAGWESAWRRVRSNRPRPATPSEAETFPTEPVAESPFLAGPTASIVGNRVGFLAFQYVTGVSAARDALPPGESLSVVDLETLDTTEHRLLPHPGARSAGPETESEADRRFADFLDRPALDAAAFSRAAAELFDSRVGPLRSLDESDLPQLPLHLAEVVVADPFARLDTRDGHPTAVGLGDDFSSARHRAALRAFELYGTLAVDPRRLVRGDGGPDRVYARNLATDAWELIDADQVYPVLAKPGPAATFPRPVGLAAALTGAEALRLALLDHCAALAAAAVDRAEEPFPELALDAVTLSDSGDRYRDAARTALPNLTAYDLTALAGIPTVVLCAGEATVSYVAGCCLDEAVAAGLVQALLYYQADASGRSRIAPPTVPEFPARLRGRRPDTDAVDDPAHPHPDWRELASVLGARGHTVHAVPVGHDPVVADVLPAVVQVVVR